MRILQQQQQQQHQQHQRQQPTILVTNDNINNIKSFSNKYWMIIITCIIIIIVIVIQSLFYYSTTSTSIHEYYKHNIQYKKHTKLLNNTCIESYAYPLLSISNNELKESQPQYFYQMFIGPGIDNYNTNTTNSNNNNNNNNNIAVCYFDHSESNSNHFPHTMQQLYRCISWWLNNHNSNYYIDFDTNVTAATNTTTTTTITTTTTTTTTTRTSDTRNYNNSTSTKQLILLFDIKVLYPSNNKKKRKSKKISYIQGFLTALQNAVNVTIISPSSSTANSSSSSSSIVNYNDTTGSLYNYYYNNFSVQWKCCLPPYAMINQYTDRLVIRQLFIQYYKIIINDPISFTIPSSVTEDDEVKKDSGPDNDYNKNNNTNNNNNKQQQQLQQIQQKINLNQHTLNDISLFIQQLTNHTVTTTTTTTTKNTTISRKQQDTLDNTSTDTMIPLILPPIILPGMTVGTTFSTTTTTKKIIVPILPRISILNRYSTKAKRSILNVNTLQSTIQYVLDTMFELDNTTTTTTTTTTSTKNNNNNNSNINKVTIQYMDTLNFLQQVQYFSNVDIIVSPHGAQLTGLFFMPPKCSHVIELLLSSWIISNFFSTLASSCSIYHSYLLLTNNPNILYNTTLYEWITNTNNTSNHIRRSYNICSPISNIVHAVLQAILQWYTCISNS